MRLIYFAWKIQFRLFSRSSFFMSLALLTPVAFVSIALIMARSVGYENPSTILFGTGLLGTWSTTLFGAGESLYMQRYSGTLANIFCAPKNLLLSVFGFSMASATLGVYSILSVWVFGVTVFKVEVKGDLLGLGLALLISLFSLVSMGIVLAAFYILSRQAMTISNLLEYPIWIITGLLFPISTVAPILGIIGKILPLGWSVEAVKLSLARQSNWQALIVALLMSVGYLLIGVFLMKKVEYKVRVSGDLVLR